MVGSYSCVRWREKQQRRGMGRGVGEGQEDKKKTKIEKKGYVISRQ